MHARGRSAAHTSKKPKRIAQSLHWSICRGAGLIRDSPKKASKKEKPSSKKFKEEWRKACWHLYKEGRVCCGHLGHHWKKKESSQHARVQVEKALACTKTLFKDALNRSSGLFWADQTSAVPASQWRKFVSTPSSMGCASSNNSTMVLNRGMPTMLKKPSCRHNTFFRYEKSHIENSQNSLSQQSTNVSSPWVRCKHSQAAPCVRPCLPHRMCDIMTGQPCKHMPEADWCVVLCVCIMNLC